MSEENQEVKEEKKEECAGLCQGKENVVKISDMLGKQGLDVNAAAKKAAGLAASGALQQAPELIQQQVKAQIEHNQELYTTLSRSILELHNDMRGFRQKTDGLDRVIFSLQQGINKAVLDLTNRINDIESRLTPLIEHWNQAVQAVEGEQEIEEADEPL